VGFVEETATQEIAALGRERGVPLLVDQGSGCLLPARESSLPGETDVATLLEMGAQIVTFSGDKLLGGPQAGLIVGEPALVARCARNPLARALRIDKNRLAALAWTLAEYASGRARATLPVLEMLHRAPAQIGARAERIAAGLSAAGAALETSIEDGSSRVGGGAAPLEDLPTRILAIRPQSKTVSAYEEALRRHDPPVIARIADGRLLVDLRTVDPREDALLAMLLIAACR
jgi:L-seryl-tRNA(Ser) seleniumtransferase